MGCFLIMTARDYQQIESRLNRGVSLVGVSLGDSVTIQVSSTEYATARQMAAMIRKAAPSAEVTTLSAKQKRLTIHPTAERIQYEVETLFEVAPVEVAPQLLSTYMNLRGASIKGAWNYAEGKLAEHIVAEVLHDNPEFGLTITKITPSTGVDVEAVKKSQLFMVEVKKTDEDKPFEDLLTDVPGKPRQCSDEWLEKSLKKSGVTDMTNVTVLGARVNPKNGNIALYQRVDSLATEWRWIKDIPLASSQFARDLYGI
jgi:hypothetical protein